MNFKCAGIINDSFVDGEGIRLAVFVQGCSHHCLGCHNPKTWDYDGGYMSNTDFVIKEYKRNPLLDGITITGGEPFEQIDASYILAKAIHSLNGNVWVYTGYTLEELKNKQNALKLLSEVDVLVDGPFILKLKDMNLKFRGSSNQRILYRGRDF